MNYNCYRKILFKLPPEFTHHLVMNALNMTTNLGINLKPKIKTNPISKAGIIFPNRIGLAAGLDKNGDYIQGVSNLGFGFIELGTVTPRPQTGNAKPRLFRLPQANALINRMGFNNKGVDYLIERLKNTNRSDVKIGINIGKNADTPFERALEDYTYGLKVAYHWADYITVNISSPNTVGLRDLHHGSAFVVLLQTLKQLQHELAGFTSNYKPIFVKIAPDLTDEQLEAIAEQLLKYKIDGVIATNTTIKRNNVENLPHSHETGGMSGAPLKLQATHVVKVLRRTLGIDFPIIAVGGIMNAEDARDKFTAGADLLQVYTGLIYRGPRLVEELLSV